MTQSVYKNRYLQLREECNNVDVHAYDCFFAFNDDQFDEGLKRIRPLRDGEKLVRLGAGCFGTKDGAKRLFDFYDSIDAKIKAECNPQEVYDYEYANHECAISWEGDLEAIRIVAATWGEESVRHIKRRNAYYPIDKIFDRVYDR